MLEDAKLLDQDYEANANKFASNVTVDGVTYATGLFWQPLQNVDDPVTEVNDAAQGILEGADLFCIKQGKAPQFGICTSAQGYKSGMLAGAVTVATALGGLSSFVAVFKVDKGWWYVCVRNDIILSDGDIVFLSEDEAKNQFMSMLAVPDWGRKIAPKDWGIDGTEDVDISSLMGKGMRVKLQRIKALRGAKLYMVIAISSVVAMWLVSVVINSIFLAPPKRPMIEPIKPKAVVKKEVVLPPENIPWDKISDPNVVLTRCYDNIAALAQITTPGWNIGDISCNSSGASTIWTREVGLIAWVDVSLNNTVLKFKSKSVDANGNSVVASVSIGDVPTRKDKPNRNIDNLRITLNDLFQAINQQAAFMDGEFVSNRKIKYRYIQFKFTSPNNPIVWRDLLTKFSGLEVKMIKYKTDNLWDYEGVIYAL